MKLIAIILLLGCQVSAQTNISGVVKSADGVAIVGANISLENSYDGTSSNSSGKFLFITSESGNQVIIASFIGYEILKQPIVLAGSEFQIELIMMESTNDLDEVTITAGSFTAGEEKRRTIFKPRDIATTAGATADIAGALNTLPGTQKVGESGRLFVRGGDDTETRTFIDGMVVMDAYRPAAPNTPSRGRFLPFMFKGTSFSTGGYSAEYGQALSSALVLSSKDKAEVNQTDISILSVGLDAAHTQVWNQGSASAKLQYTDVRPYMDIIKQRVDWISAPVSWEASTAFRQQVGNGILKFFGNLNTTSFALYDHDIANPSLKKRLDLSNPYQYGNLSFQQPIGKLWAIKTGASFTNHEKHLLIDGVPSDEQETGFHGKVVVENSITDNIELRSGLELTHRRYQATRTNESNQQQHVSFDEPLTAGFAEVEWMISKKLITKSGARVEQNNLLNNVSADPRISFAFKPGKEGQFSFAYGRFRQTAPNQYMRVNKQLDSEQAEHFILNYQVINNSRTFRVEAFYKRYFNLVKFINLDPYLLNNEGDGYAQGLEFFWRDNGSIKNVDYWVSYSLLESKRNYLNYTKSSQPTFASAHNFSAVYKHFISKLKLQAGATYSFTSGRSYLNPNAQGFLDDRTPAYHDLSLNLAYVPRPNLIFYFSCTNILGFNNIFSYQYADAPDSSGMFPRRAVKQPADRFFFLGLLITISKNKAIGQLPNL